jgi:hypothetical protein
MSDGNKTYKGVKHMDKVIFNNTVLALLKAAPGLGSVQINKGLIMTDAFYHSYFKKTLTGITYIKHWYGPVPDYEAHNELYKMEFGMVKVVKEKAGFFIKDAHYAIQEPDYSVFPERAVEIIRDVAMFITQNKAGKLSAITHDAVYENTHMGEKIPLESVYSIESDLEPWASEEKADAKKILEEISGSGEFDLSPFCAQA